MPAPNSQLCKGDGYKVFPAATAIVTPLRLVSRDFTKVSDADISGQWQAQQVARLDELELQQQHLPQQLEQ